MINKKLSLSSLLALTLITGCESPGKENVSTAKTQAEHLTEVIKKNSLTNNTKKTVYSESAQVVLLGDSFPIEKKMELPAYMRAPVRFTIHQVKPLSEIVDYLNNKFGSYGLNIGFSSDAITYLSSTSSSSSSSSSGAVGTSDSASNGFDYSLIFNASTAQNLVSNSGISMSLPHDGSTTLKSTLDRIASTANLWWEFNPSGKVVFYRHKTESFDVDLFNSPSTLNSSIGSSTSGSGDSESTSSSTSSSSSYSLTRNLGDPVDQLISGIETMKSEDGKFTLIPTLGLVTVTDTPDKLKLIKEFIDHANNTATRMIRLNVELWELVTTDETNLGIEQAINYGNNSTDISFSGIALSDTTSLGSFAYKSTSGSFSDTELSLKALQGTKSLSMKRRWDTTVANNGSVPIQYVKERAYAQKIEATTSGDTVTRSLETATTTNGMVLYASPRINSDGTIQLSLVSNLSSLDSLDTLQVDDTQVMLPERTVSSLVSARNLNDGDSVIINGFEQISDSGENNSLLGKLFWWLGGNDISSKERSIMLIMVTTHIEKV